MPAAGIVRAENADTLAGGRVSSGIGRQNTEQSCGDCNQALMQLTCRAVGAAAFRASTGRQLQLHQKKEEGPRLNQSYRSDGMQSFGYIVISIAEYSPFNVRRNGKRNDGTRTARHATCDSNESRGIPTEAPYSVREEDALSEREILFPEIDTIEIFFSPRMALDLMSPSRAHDVRGRSAS